MRKVNVLVSLITIENDFQRQQAASADQAARRLGMDVSTIFADNDAIKQCQQLLNAIRDKNAGPQAILVESVGTGMNQVAKAAVEAGIGWGIINREVDYIPELRKNANAPIFEVTADHEQVGAIQAKQFEALLNGAGGGVLYVEGPSTGTVSRLRSAGMKSAKAANLAVTAVRGDWTEESGRRAVESWLALSTSRQFNARIIGCQNDAMALGGRKAFEEMTIGRERDNWLNLPFTGCDGAPETGQKWVRQGLLAATVVVPPTMGIAVQLLHEALRLGSQPPERTVSSCESFPAIEDLRRRTGLAKGQHA